MQVRNDLRYLPTYYSRPVKTPSFGRFCKVESVNQTNLGKCMNGLVGSVKVFDKTGQEASLYVFKEKDYYGETYSLKDALENIIGKIVLKINKIPDFEKYYSEEALDHVFVSELRNHSNPNTPCHFKWLNEYKGVGTRLLQIAQKRSYEEMCNGNIELVSKNESLDFYKKLGFERVKGFSIYINPNKLYLPDESKNKLFNSLGGLR